MALTVYSDVIVPNSVIAAGVRGKQMRRNDRARNTGGTVKINVVQSITLRQYEIGIAPMLIEQWQAVEALYEVTDAGAFGMLMKDPKDCSADHTTGKASLVSAGAHTYQLFKRYTSLGSSRTKDRTITRPIASGFELKNNGVVVDPANYTLTVTTGVITIPSDPTAANLTWSGAFYVPVHFRDDSIDWELVRAGPEGSRLMVGPSVILDEVKE